MFRNFLFSSVLLGFVSFTTAAPITFTDTNSSVNAFAGVGPEPDGFVNESDSSSSTLLPLEVNALFSTNEGTSSARAYAALGNLLATTNVTSTGVFADAYSNSRFSGIIDDISGGLYRLSFNFITNDTTGGSDSSASSELFITIMSGLNTLYNESFTSTSSPSDFLFSLTPGSTGLFDITLISTANSTSGSASNAANVDFSINAGVNGVPEPHEGMLLLLGGVAMCSFIRRARSRAGVLVSLR